MEILPLEDHTYFMPLVNHTHFVLTIQLNTKLSETFRICYDSCRFNKQFQTQLTGGQLNAAKMISECVHLFVVSKTQVTRSSLKSVAYFLFLKDLPDSLGACTPLPDSNIFKS